MVPPGRNYGTGFLEPWYLEERTGSDTMEPRVEPGGTVELLANGLGYDSV